MAPDDIDEALASLLRRSDRPEDIDVPPGWRPLVATLVRKLDTMTGAWRVAKISEHDGRLRVSILCDVFGYQLYQMVEEAEQISEHTCRTCGGAGVRQLIAKRWITTCAEHLELTA